MTIVDSVSVTKEGDKWVFYEGIDKSAIAYAKLIPSMNSTGSFPIFIIIPRLEYSESEIK